VEEEIDWKIFLNRLFEINTSNLIQRSIIFFMQKAVEQLQQNDPVIPECFGCLP